jgi:hypothetical protein
MISVAGGRAHEPQARTDAARVAVSVVCGHADAAPDEAATARLLRPQRGMHRFEWPESSGVACPWHVGILPSARAFTTSAVSTT